MLELSVLTFAVITSMSCARWNYQLHYCPTKEMFATKPLLRDHFKMLHEAMRMEELFYTQLVN